MGGWIKPDLLPYSVDTWYHVIRTLDLATNTGSFYVEEVGNSSNNASYSIGSNYPNTYVNSIFMLSSNSQGADGYIDNVTLTGTVVPEPISSILFVTGGAVLAGRRYFKKKKQLKAIY